MDGVDLIAMLPIDEKVVWLMAKLVYLFGLLVYVVFAVVVARQVTMMINTLNGMLELPIRVLARVHLVLALGVLALALVVL